MLEVKERTIYQCILEDTLPYALMIGVDYDLFWRLNPKSLTPFIKAFNLKQEYDDGMAWQHGLYVKMAIASSFNKQAKYPPKPFTQKNKVKEMTQREIMDRFMRDVAVINSSMK